MHGTLPEQRVVVSTLGGLAAAVGDAGLGAPAGRRRRRGRAPARRAPLVGAGRRSSACARSSPARRTRRASSPRRSAQRGAVPVVAAADRPRAVLVARRPRADRRGARRARQLRRHPLRELERRALLLPSRAARRPGRLARRAARPAPSASARRPPRARSPAGCRRTSSSRAGAATPSRCSARSCARSPRRTVACSFPARTSGARCCPRAFATPAPGSTRSPSTATCARSSTPKGCAPISPRAGSTS